MIEEFGLLQDQMKRYINNALSGNEIVVIIDDFVSNDYACNLSKELYEKVMNLQNNVAFYVSDPKMRAEYSSYFGDERLRTLIIQFLKETSM